jgi:DNA-binding NarL/FixJ family response regulator
MSSSTPISIVIADDHAIVREGIAAICESHPDLQVAGQCSDGAAAVDLIHSLNPEFAILDLNMPKLNGLQVIRKLRESGCATKCIILSISRDETVIREALRSGANAYLVKDGPSRHLLDAIQFIREGGVYVTPLLKGAGMFTASAAARENDPLSMLSRREYEVFHYLVNGVRPKDIAVLLDISPKTVDTYRASLMRKLNIHDLVGLVKFAIDRNLTSTSPAG